MLVSCQLGETWWATLSSLAIKTPVEPMTSASHFMALSENGDLTMCHSSSPMVLMAVPKLVEDFDFCSCGCGSGGVSGSAVSALVTDGAALASAGSSSAHVLDHEGTSSVSNRTIAQVMREIRLGLPR